MYKTGQFHRAAQFIGDCSGGIATVAAVILPAMIGFGAIAFDVGYWHWDRRGMQNAADTAAVTAAWARLDGKSTSNAATIGVAMAATNGYSAANGHTVSVTVDAGTGQATANISRDADLFLSALILSAGDFQITGSAVAGPQSSGPVCILALAGSGIGISVEGGASPEDIYAPNCSIQANSSTSTALDTNGSNALMEAASICANYSEPPTGNDIPSTSPAAYSCAPVLEPFSTQLSPAWDGTEGNCPTDLAAMGDVNEKNVAVNEGDEIEAGCYIGKNINIHGDAEFESGGVFFLYDTHLSIAGGAHNVTGSEITIFLYGDSTIDLEGAQTLTLSAKPSTHPDYPSVLIAADATNSDDMRGNSGSDSKFGGISTSNLDGWIYLPYQDVKMHGAGDFTMNNGLLVTNTITRTGNGSLTVNAPLFDSPERQLVMLLE